MPYWWQFPLITFPFSDGGSSPWGPFSEPLSLCYLKKPIVWADSSSSNLSLIMLGFYARIGCFFTILGFGWTKGFLHIKCGNCIWWDPFHSVCWFCKLENNTISSSLSISLEKDLHEHWLIPILYDGYSFLNGFFHLLEGFFPRSLVFILDGYSCVS